MLLVNFGNEGGENTLSENLAFRGLGASVLYYTAQIGLMLYYLRFQRLGWGVSAVVMMLVALLRLISDSGLAILTVAMVMGREVMTKKQASGN